MSEFMRGAWLGLVLGSLTGILVTQWFWQVGLFAP